MVFPEPVPPLTRNARRDSTSRASSEAPAEVTVPLSTSSSSVNARAWGTRSEITVPGRDSGARTAWNLVPSGSRRSAYGVASSSRRPTDSRQPLREPSHGRVIGEPDLGELEARAAVHVDRGAPVDQDVGDAGQSQQRLERPRTDDVLPEQVVHRQHRRVADGTATVAQGVRNHLGSERRSGARQLFAHAVEHLRGQRLRRTQRPHAASSAAMPSAASST